jgi:predicted nucleic acid-binding protein
MGTVVLDASVVLGLLDPQDPLHPAAAAAVRCRRDSGDRFIVPASVLAEVLVGAMRRGEQEMHARRSQVVAAFGTPYPLDEAVAVAAARRRVRHAALRLPDAVVLGTADVVRADIVVTGDRRWRRLDPRVELVASKRA